MKLGKFNMFLILLFILIICCVGFSVFEGYSVHPKSRKIVKSSKNNDNISSYGRFDEKWDSQKTDKEKEEEKKKAENKEKNTYRDIVKFEDIVKKNIGNTLTYIKKSQIPEGKEHLYIKKSNVILPACPVCPTLKKCDTNLPCAPCPEPEPCPNNPIDCKMVPIWDDPSVKKHLPKPALNSFDKFNDK